MLCDFSGAVLSTLDYGEYGQPLTSTAAPHTYVGGLGVRNEGNLLYMRRRWYDPTTARFLSQDQLGLATANNVYSYPTNPVNFSDPSGLRPGLPNQNLMDAAQLIRAINKQSATEIEGLILSGKITIGNTPGAGARTTPFGITVSSDMAACDGKGAFGRLLVLSGTLIHEKGHYRLVNLVEYLLSSYSGDWAYSELEQNASELDFLISADSYYKNDSRYDRDSSEYVKLRISILQESVSHLQRTGSYPPNKNQSIPELFPISPFGLPGNLGRVTRHLTDRVFRHR